MMKKLIFELEHGFQHTVPYLRWANPYFRRSFTLGGRLLRTDGLSEEEDTAVWAEYVAMQLTGTSV